MSGDLPVFLNRLLTTERRAGMRRSLLAWFSRHARPLPWRQNRDPYAIWISEVMLQQTQVATVIPYFERFLKRFPTLAELASAGEADVLRLWEGLGYYRRARDLWRAAKTLSESHHATVPNDLEILQTLPGFGRYTVNAVLSQAYEQRLPILEANSQRVLCRLFGIDGDPKHPEVRQVLWQIAKRLLPRTSVGHFNQAVMELGALVCTPSQPRCPACPLQKFCEARLHNRQEAIPRRSKSPEVVAEEEVALVVHRDDTILLVQRPESGRWATMWECPHHPLEWMEPHMAGGHRLLDDLGLVGEITREIATIRHSVTRFRITMTCLEVRHARGAVNARKYPSFHWVRVANLHEYPLSAPQRALVRKLGMP